MEKIKHLLWLITQLVKHFFTGNIDGLIEAYFLIKIHLLYPLKKIK